MAVLKQVGIFTISIVLIFFIILLSIILTLSSFLYPQIYSQSFEELGVYNHIDKNIQKIDGATFISFPEEGSQQTIEYLLSNFLAYIRSDTDNLELNVKIDKDKLRNFFLQSVNKIPKCNINQDPFNKENPCLPQDKTAEVFLDEFLEKRNIKILESDEIDLTTVYGLEENSEGRASLDNLRDKIRYYKLLILLIMIMILTALFLLFILQKPDIRKFIRTTGIIFLASALILFIINYILGNIILQINMPDELIEKLVLTITSILSKKLILYSSAMLILSIVLFIISLSINNSYSSNNLNSKNRTKK